LGGEEEALPRHEIPFGQSGAQHELLRFAEFARLQSEMDFARVVRLGRGHAAAQQAVANLAAGQRGAVVVGRSDHAFDLLAAIVDRARRVDRQTHRLQLIVVDGERALIVLLVLDVVDQDAIVAGAGGRREQEVRVEGTVVIQCHGGVVDQPIAAVVHVHTVGLAFDDRVRVAGDLADHATDVDHLTGPIRGPVRVDVPLVAQPLRDFQAVQAQDVRRHVAVGHSEDADIIAGLQFLERFLEHAVLVRLAFAEHLGAVGQQDLGLRRRLARPQILGEHEHLVARTLDDDVQVALQQQCRRFQRPAADGHGHHAGLGRRRQRHGDMVLVPLVRLVIGDLVLERLVGIDQRDVQRFDAAGLVHLAEVGFHVHRENPHGDGFDVPRDQLQLRRLVAAEHALGGDGHGLGRQPCDAAFGLCSGPAPVQLAVLDERLVQLAEFLLQRAGDHQLGAGCFLGLGVLGRQLAPLAERGVPFLFGVTHLGEQVQRGSRTRVQRVLGEELGPQLPGGGVILALVAIGRFGVFGVDDLPLHGAPGRVRRVLGQEFLPDGQRLVELALHLVGHAQQIARVRDLFRLGVTLVTEEGRQRSGGVSEVAPISVGEPDPQLGLGGQRVFGEVL